MTELSFDTVWHRVAGAVLLAASLSGGLALAAGKHSGGHEASHGHGAEAGHGHGDLTFGERGEASDVDRTVEIVATDNKFDVETLDVEAGETIRFVIHNKGQLLHEFNIGMAAMHAAHQEEMLEMMQSGMMTPTGMKGMMKGKHGHGEMAHDDPNSVLIEPGQSGELIWKFAEAKELEFACNVPGHYQSGMHGKFHVR